MSSPGLMTHSSNHTRSSASFSRPASLRTCDLSCELWLRKTSYVKRSARPYPSCFRSLHNCRSRSQRGYLRRAKGNGAQRNCHLVESLVAIPVFELLHRLRDLWIEFRHLTCENAANRRSVRASTETAIKP